MSQPNRSPPSGFSGLGSRLLSIAFVVTLAPFASESLAGNRARAFAHLPTKGLT
jgi:hypothetical protein